jgi:hypothetical protein
LAERLRTTHRSANFFGKRMPPEQGPMAAKSSQEVSENLTPGGWRKTGMRLSR